MNLVSISLTFIHNLISLILFCMTFLFVQREQISRCYSQNECWQRYRIARHHFCTAAYSNDDDDGGGDAGEWDDK